MMEMLQTFLIAFLFSFLGSIPPGTLNLTILRLGLEHKMNIAWRFAVAAALIEYPYAWLALLFEDWVTSSPAIINNFKLITAIVMITLGVLTIRSTMRPSGSTEPVHESGFRKGLLLGILNPLALPFWIGITAYLKSQGWIALSGSGEIHSYLLGISLGALTLLMLVAYLAQKAAVVFSSHANVKFIPGVVLLVLGAYALVQYLVSLG
jgi:threonine/homoserine/homoserine lactone efflux protein